MVQCATAPCLDGRSAWRSESVVSNLPTAADRSDFNKPQSAATESLTRTPFAATANTRCLLCTTAHDGRRAQYVQAHRMLLASVSLFRSLRSCCSRPDDHSPYTSRGLVSWHRVSGVARSSLWDRSAVRLSSRMYTRSLMIRMPPQQKRTSR